MSNNTKKPAGNDIGCLETIRQLHQYLDGELDQEACAGLEEHMAHCRSCCSRAEFETALSKRILETGKGQAPDQLKKRIRKLMEDF